MREGLGRGATPQYESQSGENMDEAQAVAIARIALEPYAEGLDGFERALFISPARLIREALEKGIPDSEIPEDFRAKKDCWAVHFKLKIPPGQCWSPSTICVLVDDETGEAHIRRQL
ncbi:MAG TPA: hypothetical protein VG269_02975 [Tepidisphaeraceae bacterium]|jgi:hypothetical protein|nr:hypothetical protein [Tepidisphaeraceae bacterium]